MKVVIEQSQIPKKAEEMTYQWAFPLDLRCRKCKEDARLIMLIDDDRELRHQRPLDAKIWMHDAIAIALYLCTNCGKMRARWNQA